MAHPHTVAFPDIVGRERELELTLATLAAGRHLLLEGPPGTSKTAILTAITRAWDVPLVFVEGNAELTPSRIVGHHSPSLVLKDDYSTENFVDGPLPAAMRQGAFLYIEELNRVPEETINVLITAMSDRQITIARVGRVDALDTFRVVGSLNPADDIGTARLSRSLLDRFCRLAISYQDAESEEQIVDLRARDSHFADPRLRARVISDAVALTRATRSHPLIMQGSSVRGAIDLAMVSAELGRSGRLAQDEAGYRLAILDALLLALSGRIRPGDLSELTTEELLTALWREHFGEPETPFESG
ncbi:MoxR family ATPase [Nocardioides agariphilus]|uniref:MoxR family ATPase n=1 Tax=Nocardioides agariphilus TaxID=433664 RepID=A0A930VEV6_9ACTN|nr:MoxR family ATPase [Nocardioides agariphilus]